MLPWTLKLEELRSVIKFLLLEDENPCHIFQRLQKSLCVCVCVCVYLFVLRFYGPVNPMGSCRARSVYLTTCLLGRLNL